MEVARWRSRASSSVWPQQQQSTTTTTTKTVRAWFACGLQRSGSGSDVAQRWTATTTELCSRSARRGPQGPREGRSRDIAGGERGAGSERSAWKSFERKRSVSSKESLKQLRQVFGRTLSWSTFLSNCFFASSLPAFPSLPSNGDAIESGGAPSAFGARPALLCDEGAGERFVFLPKSRRRRNRTSRCRVAQSI